MLAGDWRSQLTAKSATGSVLSWISMGVPFLFCGTRTAAQEAAVRFLYTCARHNYRALRKMLANMEGK